MIIKITPETDAEKLKIQEVEHSGVKEFFIFGNKKDSDEDPLDFHDWSGSFRYLVGSLYYFTKMLSDEQGSKSANQPQEINLQVAPQTELQSQPQSQPQIIPMEATEKDAFIKTSNTEDGAIEGVVEIACEKSNVTKFPGQGQKSKVDAPTEIAEETAEETEMVVEEDAPNDSSKGAEDDADGEVEK